MLSSLKHGFSLLIIPLNEPASIYIRRRQLEPVTYEVTFMSESTNLVTKFAEIAFERFDRTMKDLSTEEIDWQPLKETNSIRWILLHLSQQWNVGIHRILKGDPEYRPENWPKDYVDNRSYSLDRVLKDLGMGRSKLMNSLAELTPAELEAEIPLWGGRRKRQYGLLLYLSEIFHHVGQIAFIRGAIKRRKQSDDHLPP